VSGAEVAHEILLSASDSLAKKRMLLNKIIGARNVKPHKICGLPAPKKRSF